MTIEFFTQEEEAVLRRFVSTRTKNIIEMLKTKYSNEDLVIDKTDNVLSYIMGLLNAWKTMRIGSAAELIQILEIICDEIQMAISTSHFGKGTDVLDVITHSGLNLDSGKRGSMENLKEVLRVTPCELSEGTIQVVCENATGEVKKMIAHVLTQNCIKGCVMHLYKLRDGICSEFERRAQLSSNDEEYFEMASKMLTNFNIFFDKFIVALSLIDDQQEDFGEIVEILFSNIDVTSFAEFTPSEA